MLTHIYGRKQCYPTNQIELKRFGRKSNHRRLFRVCEEALQRLGQTRHTCSLEHHTDSELNRAGIPDSGHQGNTSVS